MPIPYNRDAHKQLWNGFSRRSEEDQWKIVEKFRAAYADLSSPVLRRHKEKLSNFSGKLATIMLGRGYPHIASRLIAEGATPEKVDGEFPGMTEVFYYSALAQPGRKFDALQILLMISPPSEGGGEYKRWAAQQVAALEEMASNPSLWDFDPSRSYPGIGTPLSLVMGEDAHPLSRRMELARWLVQHGANGAVAQPQDNVLSALLKATDFDSTSFSRMRPQIEELLSWGTDVNRHYAPGALAYLTERDCWDANYARTGAHRNTEAKKPVKGPWGPLAQQLLALDLLEFDPASITGCAREDHPFVVMLEHGELSWAKAWADTYPQALSWQSPKGETLLTVASEKAQLAQCKVLNCVPSEILRPYANLPDGVGNLPLHLAVASCTPQLVEKMLSLGADPRLKNGKEQLPLQSVKRTGAKAKKHLESIQQLLLGGEEMTDEDRDAFMLQAVRSNSPHLAAQMLQKGADARGPAGGSKSYLEMALLANATSPGSASGPREAANQAKLVRVLTQYGADPTALSSQGEPLTLLAIRASNPQAMKALLDAGADVLALHKGGYVWEHMYKSPQWHTYEPDPEILLQQWMSNAYGMSDYVWVGAMARILVEAAGPRVLETLQGKPAFYPYHLFPDVKQSIALALLQKSVPDVAPVKTRARM